MHRQMKVGCGREMLQRCRWRVLFQETRLGGSFMPSPTGARRLVMLWFRKRYVLLEISDVWDAASAVAKQGRVVGVTDCWRDGQLGQQLLLKEAGPLNSGMRWGWLKGLFFPRHGLGDGR